MNIPTWIKPALMGAGVGAIALAIVGFNWGGWVTGGSAAEMATQEANAAVTDALTPYCVQAAQSAPNSVVVMAELKEASTYARSGIVEKAGWATALGTDKPSRQLALACQAKLSETL